MARTPRDVTERELAVLQELWDGGPATIRRLTEVLYPGGGAAQYATVQTFLHRLEAKGCVSRQRVCHLPSHQNKAQIYLAAIGRDELIGRRLQDMAEKLCGGSLTPLLTHLVRTKRLTADERRQLRSMIDDLDKGKDKGDARCEDPDMETLLRIGLSNAVAALLLALVVVTVACVWRRPAVLHALWLLVLVKLMTPPLVWLPDPWTETAPAPTVAAPAPEFVLVDPPTDPPAEEAAMVDPPPWQPINLAAPAPADAAPLPSAAETAAASASAATPTAPTPAPVPPWWLVAVGGVWLAGSLAWYVLAVHRLRRFQRLLRHATPAPESLRQRTQRLAEKLRLRRCPAVWLVPGRLAPMLWAAGGRPRILFPAALLDRMGVEQQNALIVHELAHLRRRDHWVRWLEFLAAGLYWWNPVLWFARRELREAEEHCCDAWVTSTLPGAGKAYATALLETLDFLSDAPPAAPLLASGVGRVSDLKRRLTMIMRGTTPQAMGWRGLLAVIGLGALLLPLLPAWARGEPPAKAEPDKKPDVVFFKFAADASPEDGDKAKEELKELEAQLAQKQAEVAALTAKVQAARARMAKTDQGAPMGRFVVQVDADGNFLALQELVKKLQATKPPAPAPEVIVIDAATGKIILKSEGTPPPPPPPPAVPAQPGFVIKLAPSPHPANTDKRIDELEQKLKSILDEVEQLRKERKPGAPENSSDPKPESAGPEPVLKIPFINGLFRIGNPMEAEEQAREGGALEREALLKRLEDEKARAERNQQEAQERARELEKELLKLKEKTSEDAPKKP